VKWMVSALICLSILAGCGADKEVVIEKPTPVEVSVPDEINIAQPVQIHEPVKVIVVNDPQVVGDFVAIVKYAGWAYGSSIGLFQFVAYGELFNNSSRAFSILSFEVRINGKEVPIKKSVAPRIVPEHTGGWYFYVRTDDTSFQQDTRYEVRIKVEKR